mmetsp:Transcript_45780/g.109190  ORF Transcript_45780/g.109190 Transcript_45780/m.109190 type:complete len:332 (+) Transcript_45780:1979-2974(+)
MPAPSAARRVVKGTARAPDIQSTVTWGTISKVGGRLTSMISMSNSATASVSEVSWAASDADFDISTRTRALPTCPSRAAKRRVPSVAPLPSTVGACVKRRGFADVKDVSSEMSLHAGRGSRGSRVTPRGGSIPHRRSFRGRSEMTRTTLHVPDERSAVPASFAYPSHGTSRDSTARIPRSPPGTRAATRGAGPVSRGSAPSEKTSVGESCETRSPRASTRALIWSTVRARSSSAATYNVLPATSEAHATAPTSPETTRNRNSKIRTPLSRDAATSLESPPGPARTVQRPMRPAGRRRAERWCVAVNAVTCLSWKARWRSRVTASTSPKRCS